VNISDFSVAPLACRNILWKEGIYFSPEDGASLFLRTLATSPHYVTTLKTNIDIFIPVITSNLGPAE
jgi:hypothetical protein